MRKLITFLMGTSLIKASLGCSLSSIETITYIKEKTDFVVDIEEKLTDDAVGLANCLVKEGVTFYGTDFKINDQPCYTCDWQKKQFGKEAWQVIKPNYFECVDPENNSVTDICNKAGIIAVLTIIFPDTVIKNPKHETGLELSEFADWLPQCKYDPDTKKY